MRLVRLRRGRLHIIIDVCIRFCRNLARFCRKRVFVGAGLFPDIDAERDRKRFCVVYERPEMQLIVLRNVGEIFAVRLHAFEKLFCQTGAQRRRFLGEVAQLGVGHANGMRVFYDRFDFFFAFFVDFEFFIDEQCDRREQRCAADCPSDGAGKREKSDSLNGSGAENLFDSLVTLGTIASALILIIWHIDLDGWVAAILSTVLVKAGLKILRRTFNEILGRRIDSQFSQMLKKEIKAFPKVGGAYDLIVNNYGPDSMVGSVNIEVPEQTTAKEIHELTQNIKQYIHQEYNIHLAVGIYAQSQNPETIKLREEIAAAVMKHPGAMEIHGFLLNENQKKISFDVVADFSVKNHHTFCNQIATQLHAAFPKYTFAVNADLDYSD